MVADGRKPQPKQHAVQHQDTDCRRPVQTSLEPSIYRRHTPPFLQDRLQQPSSVVRRFVCARAASSDHRRYMPACCALRASLVSMLRAFGPRLSARFEPAALAFGLLLGVGLTGGEYWLVARRYPSAMAGSVVGV